MVAVCNDLRIGGTLSGSGITGGVAINNSRIAVADWSGVWGHTGLQYQAVRVNGRPGAYLAGSGLALERYLILNLLITRWNQNAVGQITEASYGSQLWRNTDLLLGYLADPDGFYLEADDPNGTKRFTKGYAVDPASITATEWRRISVPVTCPTAHWKLGGTQTTNVISGAGSITAAGNARTYEGVLSFAGNGTFTNSTAGWAITIAGSSGAVLVDLGNRTVTQAGVNFGGMSHTKRDWGWFNVGANTVNASGTTVTVTHRAEYD